MQKISLSVYAETLLLAEREGFEPSRALNPTRFRDERTRPGYATSPLNHSTTALNLITGSISLQRKEQERGYIMGTTLMDAYRFIVMPGDPTQERLDAEINIAQLKRLGDIVIGPIV